MELLVVEDDVIIGRALHQGLNEAGHRCTWYKSSDSLLPAAPGAPPYDCVVLDLMLPGRHGVELLRDMRGAGVRTPVIVLTPLGSIDERVRGLEAGADDYLVKPFAFPELLARIEAVCRRAAIKPTALAQAGELQLDLSTRRARLHEKSVELTPTECSMLELFLRYTGQVVTRKMLCEHLWDFDWEGTTNVIEVHINRLRKKLDRISSDPTIQTVRGRGYVLRPAA